MGIDLVEKTIYLCLFFKHFEYDVFSKTDQQSTNGTNAGQPGSVNSVQLQPFPPKDTMV